MGNQMAPGGAMMSGMSAANGTTMAGYGQRVQGLGSVLGSQTSAYNAGQSQGSPLLGLVGTGVGAFLGGPGGAAVGAKMFGG